VLIPPPRPTYTLSPAIGDLSPSEDRALGRALSALTGTVPGVLVTAVRTTPLHHLLELSTAAGTVLVVERATVEVAVS
jgi:hypothetical protein